MEKATEIFRGVLASLRRGTDAGAMTDDLVSLRLRLLFGDRLVFGPGKGALLSRIAETGSIAAAGGRWGSPTAHREAETAKAHRG